MNAKNTLHGTAGKAVLTVLAVLLLVFQPPAWTAPAAASAAAAYPLMANYTVDLDKWTEKAGVVIADINQDGKNELLLPVYNDEGPNGAGAVYALNAAGKLLPGFPIPASGHLSGRLALGDLDNNGTLEIAAGVEPLTPGGGPLAIWDANGQPFPGWPQPVECTVAGNKCGIPSVTLADIDQDGTLEVIAATDNNNLSSATATPHTKNLYVWRASGQLAPGAWPQDDPRNVAIVGAAAVGDMNHDGRIDIAVARDYHVMFAYDALGNALPGWPVSVFYPTDQDDGGDRIEFPRSAVTLADLDGNGTLEYIVLGQRRHKNESSYYNVDLLVYSAGGTRFPGWEQTAPGTGILSHTLSHRTIDAPAVADMNNDGRLDIVAAMQDGWVRVYGADKSLIGQFNYAQGKLLLATETVIGDVDGDGANEIVFGVFDPTFGTTGPNGVYVLDYTGSTTLSGTLLQTTGMGVSGAPALGDLDGDGLVEIAASTIQGKIYVWDGQGAWQPASFPWPAARHDNQRTGLAAEPPTSFGLSTMISDITRVKSNDTVTFTVRVVRSGAAPQDPVTASISVPAGLTYVPGSLAATTGSVSEAQAPTLTWSGDMRSASTVEITYRARVTPTSARKAITSTALISGAGKQVSLRKLVITNGTAWFLPAVRRR